MYSKIKNSKKKGFTLIELLVAIGIIAFVAGLSIGSYPKFSEQMGVTTETYKLLAFLKETQTYGVNSYGSPGVKFVYGIQIEKNAGIKRVRLESPTSANNSYYRDNLTELAGEDIFALSDRFTVANVCLDETCTVDTANSISKAYILYRRPNPEARIISLEGNNVQPGVNTESHQRVVILLNSKKDENISKKIVVLKTGQAYVADW
jgi:prepilin-type N-terminal cleavage/methylation domain-containing protein